MKKHLLIVLFSVFTFCLISLSCKAGSFLGPTLTPTPTITSTPTSTPTLTPSPTNTPTPVPTETPSITPTPNLDMGFGLEDLPDDYIDLQKLDSVGYDKLKYMSGEKLGLGYNPELYSFFGAMSLKNKGSFVTAWIFYPLTQTQMDRFDSRFSLVDLVCEYISGSQDGTQKATCEYIPELENIGDKSFGLTAYNDKIIMDVFFARRGNVLEILMIGCPTGVEKTVDIIELAKKFTVEGYEPFLESMRVEIQNAW